MIPRTLFLLSTLVLLSAPPSAQQERPHSYVPDSGFVPNAATAMRIAEAVWIPIYGETQVENERPFTASLKNGVWTVIGSLHAPSGLTAVGGVALAEISRRDGRVLRVSHGK